MVSKKEMYYCFKCNRNHSKSSKIGKKHYEFRRSKKSYYCDKCKNRHIKTSKIGKKHKKYSLKKKKEKSKKIKKEKKKSKKISKKRAEKILNRKDAKLLLTNIAGKNGYKLFKHLVKKQKEINEFKLAEKVGVQINKTRSLLYKLYEHSLVSFSRERDKEKGWFIYSWKSHIPKLKEMLLEEKDKEIARLKRIEMEAQQFFRCDSCKKDYSYIQAMDATFFCPNCGDYLIAVETDDMQKEINKKVKRILKNKEELQKI